MQAIIELILLIARWWFQKQSNNADALRLFYRFVHSVNSNYLNSAAAADEWKRQAIELQKVLDNKSY